MMISNFFLHTLIGKTLIGYLLMFTIPAVIPLLFIKLVGLKGLRNVLPYEAKDSILHHLDPVVWACMKMKMPLKVGLGFSATLRFLPLMFERLTLLLQAMEVRGYDFSLPEHSWRPWEWVDYMKRIGVAMPLITVPLLVNSLRETNVMAMVVDARAFGSHKERGTLKVHNTTLAEKWGWTVYALIIVVVIALGVSGIAPRYTFG